MYSLAQLGCRELWKIRTTKYHCYGEPHDTELALKHAHLAVEREPDSHHAQIVMAIAQHYSGNNEEAIRYLEMALEKYHEGNPSMENLNEWMRRFQQ